MVFPIYKKLSQKPLQSASGAMLRCCVYYTARLSVLQQLFAPSAPKNRTSVRIFFCAFFCPANGRRYFRFGFLFTASNFI